MHEYRVLITGAAGFIGSHLVDAMLNQNFDVIGIDNMYNGKMENLKSALKNSHFRFSKTDIRDFNSLLDLLQDVQIIFHQAAFTSVTQSVQMPQFCNDVNIGGTLNLLNAARIRNVGKFVFASSAAVYGNDPTLPKREDMRLDPVSPYAVSKITGEHYLLSFHRVYGMDTTALRYFNVYGPRQEDSPYSGVIAIFLARIHQNQAPIIYGDGNQTRDFIYIKDLVRANLLTGSSKNTTGCSLNIATGNPITINEMTNSMMQLLNKSAVKIQYEPARIGDIQYSYADISLAKKLLGFTPKYDFLKGFKDYISN